MFSSLALPFKVPFIGSRQGTGRYGEGLSIEPVKTYQIQTGKAKSERTLKHLLKANHVNFSVIWNNLQFHNHTPHILGSAFILGASSDQLTTIYEDESKNHEPWRPSPCEIVKDDWRDFLGKRNYQRAYLDFFEDQLVANGYDWKSLLNEYLFEGKEPLINALVSGLAHPLIHLGYAYELNSQEIAIEALTLGACFYDDLQKYINNPEYTKPSTYQTGSVLEILARIAGDSRLDGLLTHPGADNIGLLLEKREEVMLEHWNAWDIKPGHIDASFAELQKAAAALVIATPEAAHPSGEKQAWYDFFLLHLLTSSHALRILLPVIPSAHHKSLLRQWLLFTLLAYTVQLRPHISLSRITDYDVGDKGWKFVTDRALNGEHCCDAHFVKGCRALQVAEETWGVLDGYWLKAAVKFASEFRGWGGFADKTEGYKPDH